MNEFATPVVFVLVCMIAAAVAALLKVVAGMVIRKRIRQPAPTDYAKLAEQYRNAAELGKVAPRSDRATNPPFERMRFGVASEDEPFMFKIEGYSQDTYGTDLMLHAAGLVNSTFVSN